MEVTFNTDLAATILVGLRLPVLNLPLELQLGDLHRLEDPQADFWAQKARYQAIGSGAPQAAFHRQLLQLRSVVASGDPLRIWWSDQPDDRLGMQWLCTLLQGVLSPLTQIRIPLVQARPDGQRVELSTLGDLTTDDLTTYLSLERPIDVDFRQAARYGWREHLAENAALRVNLNGHLLGVPENFYDDFLKAQWHPGRPAKRNIAAVLKRYPVGVPAWWYRYRLAALERAGELPATD